MTIAAEWNKYKKESDISSQEDGACRDYRAKLPELRTMCISRNLPLV